MSLGHQWMQQFLRRPRWEVRFEGPFENLFDLFYSILQRLLLVLFQDALADLSIHGSMSLWCLWMTFDRRFWGHRATGFRTITDMLCIVHDTLKTLFQPARIISGVCVCECVCDFGICRRWFNCFISLLNFVESPLLIWLWMSSQSLSVCICKAGESYEKKAYFLLILGLRIH